MKKCFFYFLAFASVALWGLSACSLEETTVCPEVPGPGGDTPIRFTTKAPTTRTNFAGSEWVAGDSIGIYMLYNSATTVANSINSNRKYTTVAGANALSDLAAAGSELYFQAGTPLRFIAYYPFMADVANYTVPVDVTNQDDPAAIDLLYSSDARNITDEHAGTPVRLTFQHVLSKVLIHVKVQQPSDVIIDEVQGFIGPVPLTADFQLDSTWILPTETGTVGLVSTGKDGVNYPARPAGYDTTFQAIIIPHMVKNGEAFQFRTARRLYTWDIPSEPAEFEPGMVYTFNLELQGETVVASQGSITPWTDAPVANGGNGNGEQSEAGQTYKRILRNGIDTLAVRYIPSAQFVMGVNRATSFSLLPTPAHNVELSNSYHITETEITTTMFCKFLNDPNNGIKAGTANGSGSPATVTSGGSFDVSQWIPEIPAVGATPARPAPTNVVLYSLPSGATNQSIEWNGTKWVPVAGCENFPVGGATWFGAQAFAAWAGGSLPTEAQWEYAARGGVDMAFDYIGGPTKADGYADETYMNLYAVGDGTTDWVAPVGTLKPNGYGLYDIFGNLDEWVLDRLNSNTEGYGAVVNVSNPTGTSTEMLPTTNGVMRGSNGGPATYPRMFIGYRGCIPLGTSAYQIGFRIVFNFQ